MSLVGVCLWLLLLLLQGPVNGPEKYKQVNTPGVDRPFFHEHGTLYADIDTAGHRLFLVGGGNLWQYDLKRDQWKFLDSLKSISGEIKDLEFGYNPEKHQLQFWSRGIGKMYYVDSQTYDVERVDNSFNHHNQYYHFPFFYKGALYAFGGYGLWEWHNILTFYYSELREWNIQATDPNAPMPEERVPNTGFINPQTAALYIYGGETTVKQHPDDQNITRKWLRDIWRYSFTDHKWEKLMDLPVSRFTFYKPRMINKIGDTNEIVSSFYIPDRSLWCLPVVPKDNPDNGFYLKPVDVKTHQIYKEQMLGLGNSNRLLPTNFLYDSKTKEVIIIGFDNLSQSETYPIKVVRIPGKVILAKLNDDRSAALSQWYYWLGFGIAVLVMAWLYMKYQSDSELSTYLELPLSDSDLQKLPGLTDEEKALLMYLFKQQGFLDTQQIEEYLWPDIENYDYRRKLRNEIIKSVNNKFRDKQQTEARLIIRQKDPDDKRRYLYGLNEEFVAIETD